MLAMGYYNATRPCNDCGEEIEWRFTNDGRLNKNGKPLKLPFEVESGRQHKCQVWLDRQRREYRNSPNAQKSKGVPCMYNCGAQIMFSDDQLSVNGRPIPLEMSGIPHQCPKKPDRRRGGGPYPDSYKTTQQQRGGGGSNYRNQLTLGNPLPPEAEGVEEFSGDDEEDDDDVDSNRRRETNFQE